MHVALLIVCRLTDNIIQLIFFIIRCNSFVIFKSSSSLLFIRSLSVAILSHTSTKSPRIPFWYAPLDDIINSVVFFMAASYQPLPHTFFTFSPSTSPFPKQPYKRNPFEDDKMHKALAWLYKCSDSNFYMEGKKIRRNYLKLYKVEKTVFAYQTILKRNTNRAKEALK